MTVMVYYTKVVILVTYQGRGLRMTNWEYRISVFLDAEGRYLWQDECNHVGKQGWELVSVVSDNNDGRKYGYFKRELTDAEV